LIENDSAVDIHRENIIAKNMIIISEGKAMAPSVFVLLIAMIDFALLSDRRLLLFGDVLLLLSIVGYVMDFVVASAFSRDLLYVPKETS